MSSSSHTADEDTHPVVCVWTNRNMLVGTWQHMKATVSPCASKADYIFRENARQEMFIDKLYTTFTVHFQFTVY